VPGVGESGRSHVHPCRMAAVSSRTARRRPNLQFDIFQGRDFRDVEVCRVPACPHTSVVKSRRSDLSFTPRGDGRTGSLLPNLARSFRSRAGLRPTRRRVSPLRCGPLRPTARDCLGAEGASGRPLDLLRRAEGFGRAAVNERRCCVLRARRGHALARRAC
jgi:hypothetical protein